MSHGDGAGQGLDDASRACATPHKLFHPADARRLQSLTPAFDWKSYLAGMGVAGNDRFNVSQPRFFQALDFQLRMRTLDEIKTYLRWHVAHVSAPFLSKPFVDENFDFFRRDAARRHASRRRCGSAAWRWWTTRSARRWARSSSRTTSAPT